MNSSDLLPRLMAVTPSGASRFGATWQTYESARQYEIEVDHDARSWWMRDLSDQSKTSFADGVISHRGERHPASDYRAAALGPVRLLFPERLPIWGRGVRDSDSPITHETRSDGSVLLSVVSNKDDALRKTLVFDMNRGIATRFHDGLAITILEF